MNDLEKMSVMAKADMDIRMNGNVLSANKVNYGGKITFGVDPDTFDKIITQMASGKVTHYVVLYVINKEQFDKI